MSAAPRIFALGLLGLPGAGKSTVAAWLAGHGCTLLDADAAVALAYTEPGVRQAIVARFGADAFDAAGQPRREVLAGKIFGDATARRDLEAILHPRVRVHLAATRQGLEARLASGSTQLPIVVYDVPLLAETGMEQLCDAFIFVAAGHQARLARRAARGWDARELARRDAAQASAADKLAVAGSRPVWRVDNDGDLEATERQLAEIWSAIVALAAAASPPRSTAPSLSPSAPSAPHPSPLTP